MHNYKYFSHKHAHILADYTYVHLKKVHIPVHTYRNIQIHSFIHIKKIYDQNIMKRKIFFKQKYSKKLFK